MKNHFNAIQGCDNNSGWAPSWSKICKVSLSQVRRHGGEGGRKKESEEEREGRREEGKEKERDRDGETKWEGLGDTWGHWELSEKQGKSVYAIYWGHFQGSLVQTSSFHSFTRYCFCLSSLERNFIWNLERNKVVPIPIKDKKIKPPG